MNLIARLIREPVTVTVGVILILVAGLLALQSIPVQLTPNVEDTIIAVTTSWEGASPEEVEREIIEEQEEKLQGLANLRAMTSESSQGSGVIRLEFAVGTRKETALREVSDKLREVPDYPDNVDEPVIEASDPENRDFIAWIVFGSTDPDLDIRTLQDFAEDRIKPRLERVKGMSEVNVLGGRERETQIRFDPVRLAQFGVTPTQLVNAIQRTNQNVSAGAVADAKFDVRLRTISQYESIYDVEDTIIASTDSGPVYLRDVAEVVETYKEPRGFVRSKSRPVIAINAQKEVGTNVLEVMEGLKAVVAKAGAPGDLLSSEARRRGLDGELYLELVYDQTIYIDDALMLVRQNLWLGGALAVLVLLLFLRSVRTVGIVALAIPISVVGAVVVMVALGRSINVISLAGMAFAVGLVVDNSIVVLENIYRHLEMGKAPVSAALEGVREVWGAVLAATVTTIAVFIPILLIQEEAGQLFRDIALAICAAVGLSLIVSVTVIPTCAARLLKHAYHGEARPPRELPRGTMRVLMMPVNAVRRLSQVLHEVPDRLGRMIYWVCGSVLARVVIVAVLTAASLIGSSLLMPPADYLPAGNRNLIFGMIIPPPGYNLEQRLSVARRAEETIRPYWEAGQLEPGSSAARAAAAALPSVPTFDWMRGAPGDPIVPPPVDNYFSVAFGDIMFQGGVSADPARVVDLQPLFQHATRAESIPGVLAFAFQVPLFRLGGSTGSAIKIDLMGDDLDEVTACTSTMYRLLSDSYGRQNIQPSPSNFNIFGPELQVIPDRHRLADLGMSPSDLAIAVQANGDGAIIGEYRQGGDTIDLKLLASDAVDRRAVVGLEDVPVATPSGHVVPLASLSQFRRTTSAPQINHAGRQRSVTLMFTPPQGLPLEQAVM
ncbi:MAG: efflux RND transporter permease subunit, partial [Planctomycetota bacterium]